MAAAWLVQARRLLDSIDWPPESVRIEATAEGPFVVVDAYHGRTETADAILDWALEAATRVLRGDPQPADAEVYKAARAMLS